MLTNKEIEQVYNTTDGKQDKIKIEDILKEAAKTDDYAQEVINETLNDIDNGNYEECR